MGTVINWIGNNWPAILAILGGLVPVLNVISTMAKNYPTAVRWLMHAVAFISWIKSKDNIAPGKLGALKIPFTRERTNGVTRTSANLHCLLALLVAGSLLAGSLAGCSTTFSPRRCGTVSTTLGGTPWADTDCLKAQRTRNIWLAETIIAGALGTVASAMTGIRTDDAWRIGWGITGGALAAVAAGSAPFLASAQKNLSEHCTEFVTATPLIAPMNKGGER